MILLVLLCLSPTTTHTAAAKQPRRQTDPDPLINSSQELDYCRVLYRPYEGGGPRQCASGSRVASSAWHQRGK
ncbi:hypothetical protein V8C43DRAFT_288412 [Trichoderma afarasin]